MWGRARKKPIVIEFREPKPCGDQIVERIETREGVVYACPKLDYVIKGVRGEVYPIGRDIFEETYDVVEPISGGN